MRLADDTTTLLRAQRFGRTLKAYETIGSTNTAAATWAAEGAPEGAVVLAEHQDAGRGRLGRAWASAAGLNLLFSIVLRPRLAPDRYGLLTMAAGVAVAEAVAEAGAPAPVAIKWPNDVLLEGKKCCGMLLESALGGQGSAAVILGIGLNVNQQAFPEPLQDRATSLLLATGRTNARAPLLADVLRRIEARYDAVQGEGAEALHRDYEARMHRLGQPVTLRFSGTARSVTGTVRGITPKGALLLDTEAGTRTFHAGEVTSEAA